MKAGIFFTSSGPILALTSCASLVEPILLHEFEAKGVSKFIAYEVDVEKVRQEYGLKFDIVMGDLNQTDVLRVLDHDGQKIFGHFHLDELGEPLKCEFREMAGRG